MLLEICVLCITKMKWVAVVAVPPFFTAKWESIRRGVRASQNKRNKLGDSNDCFQTAVINTSPSPSTRPFSRRPDYYFYCYYAEQIRVANVPENCTINEEKKEETRHPVEEQKTGKK